MHNFTHRHNNYHQNSNNKLLHKINDNNYCASYIIAIIAAEYHGYNIECASLSHYTAEYIQNREGAGGSI